MNKLTDKMILLLLCLACYLQYERGPYAIVPSLFAVAAGQSVFGEDIVAKIPSLIRRSAPVDYAGCGITPKEAEVIGLIAEGLSNREIASELYLGEGTVRNMISVILEKLQLKGRTQIAIFYYRSQRG